MDSHTINFRYQIPRVHVPVHTHGNAFLQMRKRIRNIIIHFSKENLVVIKYNTTETVTIDNCVLLEIMLKIILNNVITTSHNYQDLYSTTFIINEKINTFVILLLQNRTKNITMTFAIEIKHTIIVQYISTFLRIH